MTTTQETINQQEEKHVTVSSSAECRSLERLAFNALKAAADAQVKFTNIYQEWEILATAVRDGKATASDLEDLNVLMSEYRTEINWVLETAVARGGAQ